MTQAQIDVLKLATITNLEHGSHSPNEKQMCAMEAVAYNAVDALCKAGVSHADAIALRRISMTLHRWHELECGTGDDYKSYCIVRGNLTRERVKTEQGLNCRRDSFEYDDAGKPYLETHFHQGDAKARYTPVGDRERGALKRLAAIVARYPGLSYYVQGDPRGAALYILRPGDIPEGAAVDSCYSRGIVVCK